MALMLTVSKGDLAKGIPLPIDWQKFVLKNARGEASKDSQSVNYCVDMYLENDPNERYIVHRFNSKAMGFIAPFIAALAGKPIAAVLAEIKTDSLQFDFESINDKKIQGKVKHGQWEGRVKSEITDFLPYDMAVPF